MIPTGELIPFLIVAILSYLIGSIPNGLLLGKNIWQVDLREYGSKNIGATNAWRTIGKGAGIAIFLLDMLKGAISVALGGYLAGMGLPEILCGLLAVLGHSKSIFLHFNGGKGVATGLGVIMMLMPMVTLLVFTIWLIIVKLSGYVSLASIVAAASVPLLAFWAKESQEYIIFSLITAALIVIRHHSNIKRLLNGTESKIKAAKKK